MMGLDAESEPYEWDAGVGKRLANLDTYGPYPIQKCMVGVITYMRNG